MNSVVRILVLIAICFTSSATTWRTAYPYKQHTKGQSVTIVSIPFEPRRGDQPPGSTKVYYKSKLLYTIDKYYRGDVFTSDDGIYLVAIHGSGLRGITSYNSMSFNFSSQDRTAIELFKNGRLLKSYTHRELITNSKFSFDSNYFFGYPFDIEIFRTARDGCKSCREIYGRKALRRCDTSEIDLDDCEECRSDCYLASLVKIEAKVAAQSSFVRNNILYLLTDKEFVISLDFSTLSIGVQEFVSLIPDKRKFSPPRTIRRFNRRVKYPSRYVLPVLASGLTIEDGLCALLRKRPSDSQDSLSQVQIYIHTLLISRAGRCLSVYTSPSLRGGNKNEYLSSTDEALKTKIDAWLKQQIFDVGTIPKHLQPLITQTLFIYGEYS